MSSGSKGVNDSTLGTLLFSDNPPRILPPGIDLDAILKSEMDARARIQRIERQCLDELELLRESATNEGYQAGLAQCLSDLEHSIGDIKRVAKCYQQQIVELVIQCVRKICNDIPADTLMPKVVKQVLEEQVAEIRATVTVHPTIAAGINFPQSCGVDVVENSELSLTEATIDTAEFIKSIGVDAQINRLRNELHTGLDANEV